MIIIPEIIDMVISSIAISYIFTGLIPGGRSLKEDLKISAIIAVPSLLLHELGHKIIAMLFGYTAIYHANYYGLLLGLIFKQVGLPLFFIPAYVSINTVFATRLALSLVSISGPAVNMILFLLTYPLEKVAKTEMQEMIIIVMRQINKWLLILNLLPLPGLDGFQALNYLLF